MDQDHIEVASGETYLIRVGELPSSESSERVAASDSVEIAVPKQVNLTAAIQPGSTGRSSNLLTAVLGTDGYTGIPVDQPGGAPRCQWTRNDRGIPGAIGDTYAVTDADAGCAIGVRAYGSYGPDHPAASNAVTVEKLDPPTTTPPVVTPTPDSTPTVIPPTASPDTATTAPQTMTVRPDRPLNPDPDNTAASAAYTYAELYEEKRPA